MVAPLISILKTIVSPEKSTLKRLGISDGKIDRFDVGRNGIKHAKKSEKLSKSGKSKSEKKSKSQNLAKLRKKLSKIGNLTNFNATKDEPKFLTLDTRTTFNCL